MPVVTVTGNAWDHTGSPIPAALFPELWFRPLGHDVAEGALLAGVEVKASLNTTTGSFAAQLVAEPSIRYRPVLRWLLNPQEPNPQMWAWGYAEWNWEFNPYPIGGLISELGGPDLTAYSVLVSLDPPPPGYKGWYLNAAGEGNDPGDPDDPESSGTGILEIVS